MDISEIEKINKIYLIKVEEEDYENNQSVDICILTNELLNLAPMVNSEADVLAFGEFSRRYNEAMKELEGLLKNINNKTMEVLK